uniref:Uncharacterized protein n=1 Tax=Populus trichocarpa TaxID=3694 RepID=A0A3N7G4U5_POPTR
MVRILAQTCIEKTIMNYVNWQQVHYTHLCQQ